MIHEIVLNDLSDSKFAYVLDNENGKMNVLLNTKSITFKKGLNLIIGENGSGKSTLINMLSKYCLCHNGQTEITFDRTNKNSISNLFRDKVISDNHEIMMGIQVRNNYKVKVTKLVLDKEKSNFEVLDNIRSFASYYNSINLSEGEKLIFAISNTLKLMFNNTLITKLSEFDRKGLNSVWEDYRIKAKAFIETNQVDEDSPIFSLIMDEPDRNLDIVNVGEIKEILSNQKHNGQMIVSIHNPLLIYSILKLPNVNVIELTTGYKQKVVDLVDSLIKS